MREWLLVPDVVDSVEKVKDRISSEFIDIIRTLTKRRDEFEYSSDEDGKIAYEFINEYTVDLQKIFESTINTLPNRDP